MNPELYWDGLTIPKAATYVVKRIEGFSSAPYDDNGSMAGGTWTIGHGTIIDASGEAVTAHTKPITEEQAEALLIRDMGLSLHAVKCRVRRPLLECEAAALISWTYNLGGYNLSKSTMLKFINAGHKDCVQYEMRKWINQEGRPLVGLLRRRWAEAAIFIGVEAPIACARAWNEIDSLNDWPPFTV